MKTTVGPKDVDEAKAITLFFDQEIPDGVSLSSVSVVEVTKKPPPADSDPHPSDIIQGITPIGKNALLRIKAGGVAGSAYKVRVKAVDEAGDAHVIAVEFRVEKF